MCSVAEVRSEPIGPLAFESYDKAAGRPLRSGATLVDRRAQQVANQHFHDAADAWMFACECRQRAPISADGQLTIALDAGHCAELLVQNSSDRLGSPGEAPWKRWAWSKRPRESTSGRPKQCVELIRRQGVGEHINQLREQWKVCPRKELLDLRGQFEDLEGSRDAGTGTRASDDSILFHGSHLRTNGAARQPQAAGNLVRSAAAASQQIGTFPR